MTCIAVVTGSNKGIGLATVRLLAEHGATVVLTARDEKRGLSAVDSLRLDNGLYNVVFHQLDVCDPISVANLAEFIEARFGKLDILVNNAGNIGLAVDDEEKLKAIDHEAWISGQCLNVVQEATRQTYNAAVACIDTNYYGCKRVTEALLPLLRLSTSGARIVNISSLTSLLKRIPCDELRRELSDVDSLSEERIERLLDNFLEDLKSGNLESGGWTTALPSYSISKQAVNAYTRVLAKRHSEMYINCVHPGFVKSDINWNTGMMAPEDGAKGPVMLALLPDGGSSGCFFHQTTMAEF